MRTGWRRDIFPTWLRLTSFLLGRQDARRGRCILPTRARHARLPVSHAELHRRRPSLSLRYADSDRLLLSLTLAP